MSLFNLFAILITVTALLSFLNARFWRLPSTIGVMASALAVSILVLVLGWMGIVPVDWAENLFEQIDFNTVVMQGMLSFLLFAGALNVSLEDLFRHKYSIFSMATMGVIVSTVLVGTAIWWIAAFLGFRLSYAYALLFGALISPTDPIAVLGILKTAHAPRSLETMIAGESLFNDGVGVVVFTLIMGIAAGTHEISAVTVAELFLREAVGGLILGLVLGLVGYYLLKSLDNYVVEVLITLALVAGGYSLAGALHTSGPIAMVVAGLFIGNRGRMFAMSDRTRGHLDTFWELIDEILNALLFVMIGFEVLVVDLGLKTFFIGLLAIPLVLAARFVSVGLPLTFLRLVRRFGPYTVSVMTWGGVRGAISIALALSLPPSSQRELILCITYAVVVFSILVQGLTIGKVTRWITTKS